MAQYKLAGTFFPIFFFKYLIEIFLLWHEAVIFVVDKNGTRGQIFSLLTPIKSVFKTLNITKISWQ